MRKTYGRRRLPFGWRQVQVIDLFDNQKDGQATCEALYVDTLRLAAGSTLITAACNANDRAADGGGTTLVYYKNLDNDGGTIVGLGTSVLNLATADFDDDGGVDLDDYDALFDCLAGPDQPPTPTPPATAQKCLDRFDGDHDQDVDLTDVAHFERLYTGA